MEDLDSKAMELFTMTYIGRLQSHYASIPLQSPDLRPLSENDRELGRLKRKFATMATIPNDQMEWLKRRFQAEWVELPEDNRKKG